MAVKAFSNTALLMAGLALTLSLSGCSLLGNSGELKTLKDENEKLKAQIAQLQQQQTQTAAPSADTETPTNTHYLTPSPQAFDDVTHDIPTADMINDLAQLKVFDIEGRQFKPAEPITRGQYIIWLYKAYNAQHDPSKAIRMSPGYTLPFSDITATHPAYKYVQAFTNAGFSVGYDAKSFKPDKPITREEMIAIKYGVDGNEQYSTINPGFSDDAQIDKRFLAAIYADYSIFNKGGPRGGNVARAFGAIKSLKPKTPVLRYEAAGTLWQTDHRGRNTADLVLGRQKPGQY